MKKLFIILVLIMTAIIVEAQTSVWDGGRELWNRGEGTADHPYLIESAEQLAFLSFMVNVGYETKGLHFELTTDIDLNGSEGLPWTPIGLGDTYYYEDSCERIYDYYIPNNHFRGHFDGDGHKIYNLYVKDVPLAGLFGSTEAPCEIKNVNVVSGYIQNTKFAGGIVGKCNNNILISNCSNGADISGDYAGGIVGHGAATVIHCFNSGFIKGNIAGGGISGLMAKEIRECFNIGWVIAHGGGCGGIIGSTQREVTIENCYNTGRISGSGDYAGGIGGLVTKGTVKNCYNVGDVSINNGVTGGILGSNNFNGYADNLYYLNTCGSEGIGRAMSDVEMRDEAFVDVLNKDTNVWGYDKNNVNDSYPVLESFHLSTAETMAATMAVYPNPAKGSFTVEGTGLLTVMNVLGQKVLERTMDERTTVTLPEGMYLLKLTYGIISSTKKVVVY